MRKNYRKYILLSIFIVGLCSFWHIRKLPYYMNDPDTKKGETILIGDNLNNAQTTVASIGIYDNNIPPGYNWSKTAQDNDWCSGSGTQNDPYIIENIIIDGGGVAPCIYVGYSSVYFIIKDCILINSYLSGITLDNCSNGQIIDNEIANTLPYLGSYCYGIKMKYGENLTISGNTISNSLNPSQFYGIYYDSGSRGITINSTTISDNVITCTSSVGSGLTHYGIRIHGGGFLNNISRNTINFRNYHYSGLPSITIWGGMNYSISENIINGRNLEDSYLSGLSLTNTQYNIISQNAFSSITRGISLSESSYTTLFENEFNNNKDCSTSIKLLYNNHNISISNHWFEDCENGILLDTKNEDISIYKNNFIANSETGICLNEENKNNTFTKNIFLNNKVGIKIAGNLSWFNLVYNNCFVGNDENAIDDIGVNSWDSRYILVNECGNYWDDYDGVDENDDGIGDTWYMIPGEGNNHDQMPLMECPFQIPSLEEEAIPGYYLPFLFVIMFLGLLILVHRLKKKIKRNKIDFLYQNQQHTQ